MDNKKIIKNIIALSGEPVSGKGTTVKEIKKLLIEQGYQEENIHIVETGSEFRRYFKAVIALIQSMHNSEEIDESIINDELKNLFSQGESRNKFIKFILNLKSKKMDLSNFSIDDANSSPEFKEIREIIDKAIDGNTAKLGKKIAEEENLEEMWIFDSRLAFDNIPGAFSTRFTTRKDIAGQRLFNDSTRGNEDKYNNLQEAIEEREKRRKGEIERYKQKYNVDLSNEDNYNLIIDTSFSTPQSVAKLLLECQQYYVQGKYFARNWTSPKTLLPLQGERDTLGKGMEETFESLHNKMKEEGYLPDREIEIVEANDARYIIEGHHRNCVAGALGIELVPYIVLARDDEKMPGEKNTARQRVQGQGMSMLYGHEMFFDKPGKAFSYSEIYPEIVEKLKKEEER